MTVKVRLENDSIITPKSYVVETTNGEVKDFGLYKLAESFDKQQRESEIIAFLEEHFYIRDDADFISCYKRLDITDKNKFLTLLKEIVE